MRHPALSIAVLLLGTGHPAAAASGSPVPFASLAQSVSSAVTAFEVAVVGRQDRWRALWRRHNAHRVPLRAPPAVDFASRQVLAVFLGSRPDGCHAVVITAVERMAGRVVVTYQERRPAPDAICSTVITNPAHIVSVPRSPLPVVFQAATPAPSPASWPSRPGGARDRR